MTTLFVLASRRTRLVGTNVPAGTPTLDAYDLAMLNGGEKLAVATAVANLREAGAVTVEDGRLRTTQPLPHGAHPVEQGVYQALDEASSTRLWSVQATAAQHPALIGVRERLIHQGLLHLPSQSRTVRRLALWFLPVLALGIARLIAGMAASKPVGYLLVLLALTVGVALWVARRPAPQTPSGQQLLKQAHDTGALNGLALGGLGGTVALLGLGALWARTPSSPMRSACSARHRAPPAASMPAATAAGAAGAGAAEAAEAAADEDPPARAWRRLAPGAGSVRRATS